MDNRNMVIVGAIAALGIAWFAWPRTEAEGGSAIAAAHAGAGAPGEAAGSAKNNSQRSGNVDVKGAAKGDDEDESWSPGGEHEPNADDAQQWHWLQQDLDRMIDNTRPKARKRIEPEAFRDEYLSATVKYLQLEGEERRTFETAAATALTAVADARSAMQAAQQDTPYDEDDPDSIEAWKDAQATFKDQQAEAAEQLVAAVPKRGRTTLLREEALRWVVRYDFGMQHAGRAASR